MSPCTPYVQGSFFIFIFMLYYFGSFRGISCLNILSFDPNPNLNPPEKCSTVFQLAANFLLFGTEQVSYTCKPLSNDCMYRV